MLLPHLGQKFANSGLFTSLSLHLQLELTCSVADNWVLGLMDCKKETEISIIMMSTISLLYVAALP